MRRILLAAALLLLPGCWIYTGGDRIMVSGARDQVKRAALKLDGRTDAGPVLEHLQTADEALAAMDERHGRASIEWPEDDKAADKAVQQKIGAYKSTTEFWARMRAGLTGILGLVAGNPWTAGLVMLFTASVPTLLILLGKVYRRLARTEKAALRTVDNLTEATEKMDPAASFFEADGDGSKELRDATKPLAEIYAARRK